MTLILLVMMQAMKNDDSQTSDADHRFACGIHLLKRHSSLARKLDARCVPLIMFIAANLLTGLVNMSMRTRTVSVCTAMLTLSMHALVAKLVAVVFYRRNRARQ